MSHIQTDGLAILVSGAHSRSNSNGRKCGFTERELWSVRYNIEEPCEQTDWADMVLNDSISLMKIQFILATE